METIYAIIENRVIVESGVATTVHVVLPRYGYYKDCNKISLQAEKLSQAWASERELSLDGYGLCAATYLERFYTMYGCEPYDYVSINIHDWEKK